MKIARKGFEHLNAEVAPGIERQFANEAFGFPQLMQSICLNLCYTIGLTEKRPSHERVTVTPDAVAQTLRWTSSYTDFSKMLSAPDQAKDARN